MQTPRPEVETATSGTLVLALGEGSFDILKGGGIPTGRAFKMNRIHFFNKTIFLEHSTKSNQRRAA